ncbi:MAG: non-homologous end-joining DNA ligase [Verrucomicrobia bacterium]|nr:non-homologous end-joining DNA ligase [Verrucomicrobiota bacterium]
MKARAADELPVGSPWLYELKFDGYRFLGAKSGRDVRLWSRNGLDLGARFPQVASALAEWKAPRLLVDGELVVLDAAGRPSFQLVQRAEPETDVRAVLFDVLTVGEVDLTGEPLSARREALRRLLRRVPDRLSLSAAIEGDPETVLAAVRQLGLEGIVAKDLGSTYRPGARDGAWRKVKCVQMQEFVVGGFTPPKGSRRYFGALLLGYFEGESFRYAGRVGTGFDEKALQAIEAELRSLRQQSCPFAPPPTTADARGCTWVQPTLVVQVRFAEWTSDGLLRHASFLGVRTDKLAREVGRM